VQGTRQPGHAYGVSIPDLATSPGPVAVDLDRGGKDGPAFLPVPTASHGTVRFLTRQPNCSRRFRTSVLRLLTGYESQDVGPVEPVIKVRTLVLRKPMTSPTVQTTRTASIEYAPILTLNSPVVLKANPNTSSRMNLPR
jgi:hypothetical protein